MKTTIITLASQKGGVGKSTLSIHIATYYASLGHKVAIIDCDPQKSVYTYNRLLDHDLLVDLIEANQNEKHFLGQIKDLDSKYDIVIFDTAGKLDTEINGIAVKISDLLITPTALSVMDLISTSDYYNLIKKMYPDKKHYIVLNRTKAVKELKEFREFMRENKVRCFGSTIPDKRSFVRDIDFKNRIQEDSFDGLMVEIENSLI